jgi:hypothetical protein
MKRTALVPDSERGGVTSRAYRAVLEEQLPTIHYSLTLFPARVGVNSRANCTMHILFEAKEQHRCSSRYLIRIIAQQESETNLHYNV